MQIARAEVHGRGVVGVAFESRITASVAGLVEVENVVEIAQDDQGLAQSLPVADREAAVLLAEADEVTLVHGNGANATLVVAFDGLQRLDDLCVFIQPVAHDVRVGVEIAVDVRVEVPDLYRRVIRGAHDSTVAVVEPPQRRYRFGVASQELGVLKAVQSFHVFGVHVAAPIP